MPAPAANTTLTRLRSATAIITSLSLLVTQSAAYALPVGGQVAAGQATISTSPNALTVNQSSNRAILNWQGFNIGSGETVNVVEPSAASIELERVSGSQNPSQIMGSLSSNGQVWLVSPGGVMFGSSAQVNVAGLVATSSDVDNNSFMNGIYSFTHPGNPNALISNAGSITISDNGLAALVGPNVTNSGLIQAKLGKVALASGDTFALDLYGDGLINLQASSQITQQVVSNSGSIKADGGTVLLTAAAAQGAINSVINMTGLIQANSVGTQNGTITLYAEGSNAVPDNIAADKGQKQGNSEVLVSGTLDATGYAPGQTGGSISVLGDHVGILAGSTIDASGDAGGGTIKVGGDFHGQGTTPTAEATIVQSGATILANAIIAGSGGNVTVWADDTTNFAGTIQANGGANGGNGGFVETSGRQTLSMEGNVDASAPHGTAGIWLLDPNNLIINATATANAGSGPAWTAASGGGNVLGTDINAALNGGTSVDLTASGSIEVAAGITKSAGSDASLTLAAGQDITIDTGIAIASTTGKLNVTLDADTALGGGAILMNSGSSITSNGGNITLGGGANPLTTVAVGDAATSGAAIVLGGGNTLNAGAGNIILLGTGISGYAYNAIAINGGGTLIETTTGAITIDAQDTEAEYGRYTLYIASGSTITTSTGSITLSGSTGNTPNSGSDLNMIGVALEGIISSTGTGSNVGAITITGTGHPNGSYYSFGLDASGTISSVDGNISLTGTDSSSALYTPGVAAPYNIGLLLSSGLNITSTGNGAISLIGTGDINNNNDNLGIQLNSAVTVSAHNGSISFQGTGGGNGTSEYGLYLDSQITSTGTAPITLTGTGASGASDIYFAGNAIGGASDTGAITFNANSLGNSSLPMIQTTGNVDFAPRTASTPIGISGGAGTLAITSGILSDITAGSLTIGSTSSTGNITVGTQTLPANELIETGSGNIEFTGAQTDGTHSLTAVTGSGNITLDQNAGIASTASGNAIVLNVGGHFINNDTNDGVSALSAPDGRWLIYSNNPSDDTLGGLSGSGLIYTDPAFNNSAAINSNVNLTAYSLSSVVTGDQAAQSATPLSNLLTFDLGCGSADAFTVNCQGDDGR